MKNVVPTSFTAVAGKTVLKRERYRSTRCIVVGDSDIIYHSVCRSSNRFDQICDSEY
jgi:hypothetical protein